MHGIGIKDFKYKGAFGTLPKHQATCRTFHVRDKISNFSDYKRNETQLNQDCDLQKYQLQGRVCLKGNKDVTRLIYLRASQSCQWTATRTNRDGTESNYAVLYGWTLSKSETLKSISKSVSHSHAARWRGLNYELQPA